MISENVSLSCHWEMGSFYHLDCHELLAGCEWLPTRSALFGSGRDALRAIIKLGKLRGWRRIWIPTYYCHDVTTAISKDIEVRFYSNAPFESLLQINIANDEAIVVVEYFGLKAQVNVMGGNLIIDCTHAPCAEWHYSREPDYRFASLRKFLPIPDGGFAWQANKGSCFPTFEPSKFHIDASNNLLTAMLLKSMYISGIKLDKSIFLNLAQMGESKIGDGQEISGISDCSRALISLLNTKQLIQKKRANLSYLDQCLNGNVKYNFDWVITPAYLVLLTGNKSERELIRLHLISHNIYPAVLWVLHDLPEIPDKHKCLADRILVLHVDARYTILDIDRLLTILTMEYGGY